MNWTHSLLAISKLRVQKTWSVHLNTQQTQGRLALSRSFMIFKEKLEIVNDSIELFKKFINFIKFVRFIMQSEPKLHREEQKVMQDVAGFCMSLGLCKAIYENDTRIISHMPVSFYPYLLSARTYYMLRQIHFLWQKLFVKISTDKEFVTRLAKKFCFHDPFMERILQIYLRQKDDGVRVACTRVDYMGDQKPQLVEYNLMSVGLNAMSDRVQLLHENLNHYKDPVGKYTYPRNKSQQTLCKALFQALESANLRKGLILMVVHEKEFNYGDHHAFRIQMIKTGRKAEPVTMEQLIEKMDFNQQTEIASIDGQPIDAFYFRTGYAISHFPTENHWKIREQIERSKSIKLPSIEMILINSKRMQSQIAKPEVLQKYLTEIEVKEILNVSGQIHDFDEKTNEQVEQLIKRTKEQGYVLKPNRQGGGNNFFDEKAHGKLVELYKENEHLNNYILMKKIKSKTSPNYFIMEYKSVWVPKVTAEFSTLGCFVYENGKIILNETGGTLVRLKRQEVNQGGIAINQGAISGVCVINYQE